MMQGLYTSSTGMQTHSQGLGIIGNNLANTNTVGFKQQLMLFDNQQSKTYPQVQALGLNPSKLDTVLILAIPALFFHLEPLLPQTI